MKTPCSAKQCLELSSSPATQDGQELRAHGQTEVGASLPGLHPGSATCWLTLGQVALLLGPLLSHL